MQVWFRYVPPGSFLSDAAVGFRLDDEEWWETSFAAGLSQVVELAAGPHKLASRGIRTREWVFEVPEHAGENDALLVEIRYSRAWGNFGKTLDVRTIPADDVRPDDVLPALAPEEDLPPFEPSKPLATFLLIGVLALVFALEFMLPVAPRSGGSPALSTLRGLGGLDVQGMRDGQWFRLIACTFLHADPAHLLCNLAALLMVGFGVEGRLGWRWMLTLYALGGLGGSLVSLALNDGHTVSVGASGAIMGLFAGGLFVAQTMPKSIRAQFQVQLLRVLLPSLVPLGTGIDIGAHLGGALTGALVGAFVMRRFGRASREDGGLERFRRARLPLLATAAFVAASAVSAALVATVALPQARVDQLLDESLIPNEELTDEVSEELRYRWINQYPDDPRVIVMAIGAADDAGDAAKADALLQKQRANLERYRSRFPAPAFDALVRATDEAEVRSRLVRRLLPLSSWPLGPPEQIMNTWRNNLSSWVQTYPDDPSIRERAAVLGLDRYKESRQAADLATAERHARHGLAHVEEFRSVTSNLDEIKGWLSFVLWQVLSTKVAAGDTGAIDEANRTLRDLCAGSSSASKLATERQWCPPAAAP